MGPWPGPGGEMRAPEVPPEDLVDDTARGSLLYLGIDSGLLLRPRTDALQTHEANRNVG